MNVEQKKTGFYKIRDGKRRVLSKLIAGAAAIGCGLALAVHAYWHAMDPYLLGAAAAAMLIGMYLSWDAENEIDQQMVEFGRGIFGQNAN